VKMRWRLTEDTQTHANRERGTGEKGGKKHGKRIFVELKSALGNNVFADQDGEEKRRNELCASGETQKRDRRWGGPA